MTLLFAPLAQRCRQTGQGCTAGRSHLFNLHERIGDLIAIATCFLSRCCRITLALRESCRAQPASPRAHTPQHVEQHHADGQYNNEALYGEKQERQSGSSVQVQQRSPWGSTSSSKTSEDCSRQAQTRQTYRPRVQRQPGHRITRFQRSRRPSPQSGPDAHVAPSPIPSAGPGSHSPSSWLPTRRPAAPARCAHPHRHAPWR